MALSQHERQIRYRKPKPMRRPKVETVHNVSCMCKKRWPSEESARAGAGHCMEVGATVDMLFVYRCPVCIGWHLTKSSYLNGAGITADDLVAG